MAIAHVVSWTAAQDVSSTVSLTSQNSTGANFVVVAVTIDPGHSITSVTGNKGETYSLVTGSGVSNGSDVTSLYIAENVTGGTGHTISVVGSGGSTLVAAASAFSGLATSSTFDKKASGTGNSSSLSTSATATTAQANELLIGYGNQSGGTAITYTAGGSFTMRSSNGHNDLGNTVFLESQVVSSTGAYTGAATSSASNTWAMGIATFKDAVAGGSSTTVTPGVGSVTVGGLAPTETKEKLIAPNVGALTLAGLAPSETRETLLVPGVGALSLAGLAPAETRERTITPGVGLVTLSGLQPTLQIVGTQTVLPGVGAITVQGLAPGLQREVTVTPALPSLASNDNDLTPTILTEWTARPGVGSVVLGGLSPNVLDDRTIAPTTGLVVLQGLQPTVNTSLSTEQTVAPGVGLLTLQGQAPALSTTIATVTPAPALLTLQGLAPGNNIRGHVNTGRRWRGRAYRYDLPEMDQQDAPPVPAVALETPTFQPLGAGAVFKALQTFDPPPIPVADTGQTERRRAEARRRARRRAEEKLVLELLSQGDFDA